MLMVIFAFTYEIVISYNKNNNGNSVIIKNVKIWMVVNLNEWIPEYLSIFMNEVNAKPFTEFVDTFSESIYLNFIIELCMIVLF